MRLGLLIITNDSIGVSLFCAATFMMSDSPPEAKLVTIGRGRNIDEIKQETNVIVVPWLNL